MGRKIRRDNLRSQWLHRLMDIGICWLAIVIAYQVKEVLRLGIPTEPITHEVLVHTFAVVALIWLAVASGIELYHYKRRLLHEILTGITALVLTVAFFNSYVYFTRPLPDFIYPRYGTVLFVLFSSALFVISRAVKHVAQRALHRRGFNVRRVVIVGTGPTAQRLASAFREDHALGYRFVGFVCEAGSNGHGCGLGERGGNGEPGQQSFCVDARDVLGGLDGLEQLVRTYHAEEVIVALPGYQHQAILDIAHRCQDADLRLRVVPDLFEVIMIRATLSEIDSIPLIGLRDPVITGYQSLMKRAFDVVTALFCLVLAAPLFVVIPIAIWLDSRGPIFFRQTRVGENGKPFAMYKFRSMDDGAEQRLDELVNIAHLPEPVFKLRDDPRVTRVGRWLRRMSLDELPQLLNVLRGDMSMVGPRPEEVQVVQHYKMWHRKRLSIKPGITGPMQVAGRGELSLDERINLELMYISRYSILEDVKYLFRTIPAVCKARGAY